VVTRVADNCEPALNHDVDDVYQDGQWARMQGSSKDKCPFGRTKLRHQCAWLAGWVDMDNEMKEEW
jgi:ribosome modulation factor